jgi:hypothetical protein
MLEKQIERACLAQSVKAFPDAVQLAGLRRQSPPCDVVDRKIVQYFEEQPVVAAFVASAR